MTNAMKGVLGLLARFEESTGKRAESILVAPDVFEAMKVEAEAMASMRDASIPIPPGCAMLLNGETKVIVDRDLAASCIFIPSPLPPLAFRPRFLSEEPYEWNLTPRWGTA